MLQTMCYFSMRNYFILLQNVFGLFTRLPLSTVTTVTVSAVSKSGDWKVDQQVRFFKAIFKHFIVFLNMVKIIVNVCHKS